ncbi:MAG TPA: S8 family serine peptidase [Phycisphaerales bacterium]|nr:S8 family serine peptidase [Phycisphaerales bacterium]
MKMCHRIVIAAGTVVGLAGASAFGQEGRAGGGGPLPVLFRETPGELEFSGLLIVRPLQEHRRSRSAALIARDVEARQRLAAITAKYYPEVDEYVVRVPAGLGRGTGENRLAVELMATGDYEYVSPDWTCYPIATPNDPMYSSQWHHPKIGSPTAWNYTFGSSTIISAATDTGIDTTHPDLAANRVPGYNAPANKAEVNGGSVSDVNGHGTHVAGCAAAIGNNAKGVSGVNMNARIMMCRVTDASNGSASMSEILEGARWAADNGAKVIGSSYSGVNNSSIQTTGEYIRSKNAIYCFAAGNDGANLSTFDHKDVIVVGASDSGDNRAGFSAYGRAVDVFSPGVNILSTVVGGGYQAWSGTSMATPVCNGALTMIWSANPSLTAAQVENILFYACDDLGSAGEDETYGWGRINVGRAVQWAVGPAPAVAVGDSVFSLTSTAQTIDVLSNDVALDGGSFTLTSHATTSARGGLVERLAGMGPGGRDILRYTPPATPGADSFTYTIQGSAGGPSNATVQVNVESAAGYQDPANPEQTRPGVDVSYYDLNAPSALPDYAQLAAFKTDAVERLSFASTNGTFSTSGRQDNFGAVYEGYITIPQPAEYTFYANSDDGSRLYIGGTLVVDNDGLKSPQAWAFSMVEKSGKIKLKAGVHRIRAELFERTGSVGLIVSVAGGGMAKQVIPASMFSRDAAACNADFDGSGFLDIEDFDAFVAAFEAGEEDADFDGTGFVDIEDYDAFIEAFETGC